VDGDQEIRAMTRAHAELETLGPDERLRAFAWLLVPLKVDVVDVYQEAKRQARPARGRRIAGRHRMPTPPRTSRAPCAAAGSS
jgi:hypothetical protein